MNAETLGPAERLLNSVLSYTDHLFHNRPGIVMPDARFNIGVRWEYATYKDEGDARVAYFIRKDGKKTVNVRAGIVREDDSIVLDGGSVGTWRHPGIFPEVAAWLYRQVAEVWKLDNEFAAKWASYQFAQEHRDLKVILAAFMLVQSRKGEPVMDGGKLAFYDDDFRDIGEAMMLIYGGKKGGTDLSPKHLVRIREVLEIPAVAAMNRELGFGRSSRQAFLGRWSKAVSKWLLYREENPKLLEGAVKAGFRSTIMELASAVGYKPTSPAFFRILRWKQKQSNDGRRTLAIGEAVSAAESWKGWSEAKICQHIEKEKPAWKRIVSMVPPDIGVTRAIMIAAVESGSLSNKDLIIATPTIEELGLMDVQEVKTRWQRAVREADDMRAANIAARVKSKAVKTELEEAADNALKKGVEEVMRGLRVYVFIDRSGSMMQAIVEAKRLITRMLPAFPADKLHVAHFNTMGVEVTFKARTAVGVEQAFRGVEASGGTDYGSGVRALEKYKPTDDEDVLFIFVGDQQAANFAVSVRNSGLRPMAFGFVYTPGSDGNHRAAVQETARILEIPCFDIKAETFADTYAIPRTIRALVAATPVGTRERAPVQRFSLAETIQKTELLRKPAWAA